MTSTPATGGTDVARPDGALGPPDSAADLGRAVKTGLGWSLANNAAARAGNLVMGIVLARILSPENYGVFAVSLVVLNAALSMNELGVSLAVIRRSGPVAAIAPTVATIALAWSLLLFALCFFLAPAVASAMGVPGAVPMIRVLALAVIVDGLAAVPSAILTRRFMQKRRLIIDLVSLLASGALSIVLAVLGAGAWALVIGMLASTVLSGAMTIAWSPERFWPGMDRAEVRELLRFGMPLAGASALMFMMLNVDYIVVGNVGDPTQLGLYLLAFNLCSWPVSLISVAIRRVSFAGFSRVVETAGEHDIAFSRACGLTLCATAPLCALLGGFARPVIQTIYGGQWVPAASALSLLCLLGGARIMLELAYDYLTALGHTRTNMVLQAVWFLALVPSLILGMRLGGVTGVALAHGIVAVGIMVPLHLVVLRRRGVRLAAMVPFLGRAVSACLAVLVIARAFIWTTDSTTIQFLAGGATASIVAYLCIRPRSLLLISTVTGRRRVQRALIRK